MNNPSLLQINTRVWLQRMGQDGQLAALSDIPDSFLDYLADRGIDYVWLMGIWRIVPSAVQKYAFEPGLVQEYKRALHDWTPEDVFGSPYAIDQYEIHPHVATKDDLAALRSKLHQRDIGLILDFVPNHFNAHTSTGKLPARTRCCCYDGNTAPTGL